MSDTASAGSATSADVSASSAQTTETPVLSQHQRMLATVNGVRNKSTASQAEGESRRSQANSEPATTVEDNTGYTDDVPGEDKPIPKAAFLARLAREKTKLQEAQSQNSAKDLELQRANRALQIMDQEYKRLQSMVKIDPKDAELNQYRLQELARQQFEDVNQTHQTAQQEAVRKAELSDARAALKVHVDRALSTFPDVTFEELKAAALKTDSQDVMAIAKSISDKRRDYYLQQTRPPAPPSIRGGTSGATRGSNSTASMVETVKALMAKG